ncbi:aspartate/glutamate racemase family protein [Marinicella sp. W31]|uniref:aspartate/glutamate racemase family protein n=1 Tax=Marinicella sp. W31 TaxID=3023713 RepID=UPI0037576EAC
MKKIGLIGGMSWQSTVLYYQHLNRLVHEKLGGSHSAHLLLESLDFAHIEALQEKNDWQQLAAVMTQAAVTLERGGAEIILICSNTMHDCITSIEAGIQTPVLHIADAMGRKIQQAGMQQVGLLGTRYTMERDFLKNRLQSQFDLQVMVPPSEQRTAVHRVIFEELIHADVRPESQLIYQNVIEDFKQAGCEAVIMGCTEITLLLNDCDTAVPVFDSTQLHAEAAVSVALSNPVGI